MLCSAQATNFAVEMGGQLANLSTEVSSKMYYDWCAPAPLSVSVASLGLLSSEVVTAGQAKVPLGSIVIR